MTTDAEKNVCNQLAAAWDSWLKLDDKHPHDVEEFRLHINALQNMVAWRVARRDDPGFWGSLPKEGE